jgi:L-asparaginase
MPKIVVLSTGGTIFGVGNNRVDFCNYKSGSSTSHDIFEQIPELLSLAEFHFEELDNFSSCEMTPAHWTILKKKLEYYLQDLDYDGAVITHGTNTLEETAYFLHLTCNTDKPIVLVGSQRPPTALSSDAHLNLYNATRLAASPEAIGKGVLVMLNDEINSAREVTKTNTYRSETFQSGQMGFLGYVDVDGKVIFYRQPTKLHTTSSKFRSVETETLSGVEIIYSYAGSNGYLINSLLSSDIKGIVIAGTGAGKFSNKECEALIKARKKGIHVVRSSRVGNGRVVQLEQYKDHDFIAADNLLPQKARILLMLALQVTTDPKEIQHIFDQY